ncbi:Transcriptional regulator, AraC family [Alteracholeplasma palmae J233]|uniref:Transcriptional regulator, AraC family n=1 Tax=Alteracholeplasma palmae (strain ATCC 49389 / J233) TaxID=1318466 RepID=U4KS56_ALTPJ|nr:helix-turn-helix domain-containing protein [Alteracholeplasma palmae]CCV64741.1 Transcriptional regulator, AraC family [Alteracholeplasma palmae J233]
MNIYELMQKVIEEIEKHLEQHINIDKLASSIGMSLSNVYRFFLSLVGYNIKEYVRLRRISEAASKLKQGHSVTDLAYLYTYDTPDSFTRAFKKITGVLPSKYKKEKHFFQFKKINILERNFMNLEEKALGVKILKHMESIEVIYFNYYGNNPEDGAFELFKKWAKNNKIDIVKEGLRVFGYNNPNPKDDSGVYGYELCVTLNKNIKQKVSLENIKVLEGGMYAVVTVKKQEDKHIGQSIAETWQRFGTWLQASKFILTERQWLEEHHDFDQEYNHIGNVDLYMSIDYKDTKVDALEIREMKERMANYYTFKGSNAISEGRSYITTWFLENKIDLAKEQAPIYIFGSYDLEEKQTDDFEYKLYFITENIEYKKKSEQELVLGKTYVRKFINFENLTDSWDFLYGEYKNNETYKIDSSIIYEQYLMETDVITNQTTVLQLLQVTKK